MPSCASGINSVWPPPVVGGAAIDHPTRPLVASNAISLNAWNPIKLHANAPEGARDSLQQPLSLTLVSHDPTSAQGHDGPLWANCEATAEASHMGRCGSKEYRFIGVVVDEQRFFPVPKAGMELPPANWLGKTPAIRPSLDWKRIVSF